MQKGVTMPVKRPSPQQITTTVRAAGPQDIAISSHHDGGYSWVAVRVGQVLTYAHGLTAPESVSRIWTEAETRAASLLPPATATNPQLVHGPGIVVNLRGEQSTAGRNSRDADAFPYDGRTGSGHVVVGGVLWRLADRDALISIADAWRRAAAIARTF